MGVVLRATGLFAGAKFTESCEQQERFKYDPKFCRIQDGFVCPSDHPVRRGGTLHLPDWKLRGRMALRALQAHACCCFEHVLRNAVVVGSSGLVRQKCSLCRASHEVGLQFCAGVSKGGFEVHGSVAEITQASANSNECLNLEFLFLGYMYALCFPNIYRPSAS